MRVQATTGGAIRKRPQVREAAGSLTEPHDPSMHVLEFLISAVALVAAVALFMAR